jgi:hypothetical protein
VPAKVGAGPTNQNAGREVYNGKRITPAELNVENPEHLDYLTYLGISLQVTPALLSSPTSASMPIV